MVNTAPTPVDVLDFQFKLRYRLKVFQNEENGTFSQTCSLIASVSRFGLLFVGTCSPCFQVLQLQSLDKYTAKDGDIADYNRRTVPLPSRPKHLAVNCDCTKLCVVVEKDDCAKAIVYDVTSFLKQNISIVQEIRLSPTPGVVVIETCWNPGISSVFSVCKSDGSLGLYELKETGIEITELPPTSGATCMCWSPKGKQIAVGSNDGKITQYKPDLKVARVVNAPVLEGSQSVVAVQWVSNYQFIAVYKSSNPDIQLNMIVVDFPKVGDTVFTNYEDICYSYGNTRPHQFYLLLQSTWNILMVASSNSMEMGVLAYENAQWTQWVLIDSARAELPLSSTKQDTLPVGMTFDTSSTQPYPWGETTLPPMPLVFLLSHHGTLCCFNAVNLKKDAVSVCHSPEQLSDLSGLSQFTTTAVIPSKPMAINPLKQIVQQPTAVSQAFSFNQAANIQVTKTVVSDQIPINQPQSQLIFGVKPAVSQTTLKLQSPFSLVNNIPTSTKADSQTVLNLKSIDQAENLVKQQKPSENDSKPNVVTPQKVNQIQPAEVTVLNEDTEMLIAQMVKEECAVLEMELMALLQRGYELKVDMGSDSEATNLVQSTNKLEDFVNEATETSSSQAAEIHSLKQSLIQTWVWYEEARSRFITFKDPKLIALMHAQPLDPASERQLADIRHLFYYIESQLNQANVALDEQWESFQDSCKKKLHLRMPSVETIYQSMVKQNATLQKQTYILKDLSNRMRRKHRDYQIPHLIVSLENADSLEEQLKNLHFQPSSIFHLQHERVLKRQKLLTKAKSDKLTNLLLNRKVVHVSVSKPKMLNTSLQLNSLLGEPFSPITSDKKLLPQKLDFVQSTPKAFMKPEPKTLVSTANIPEITKPQVLTVNKPLSAPPVSLWGSTANTLNVEVSKSTGSAFVPTTQTVSFGIKPSGNNLLSSNNQLITSTSNVKSPSVTTAEQKFFFSFNTPTTLAITTSTMAKTTATTNSTNIFNTPVSSSTTDGQKTFFFKRQTASSSPFSFQTLSTDTTAKTSSSFTAFNFSTSQNSLLKIPSSSSISKISSAPTFVSQITSNAEISKNSVTESSLSTNSTTVRTVIIPTTSVKSANSTSSLPLTSGTKTPLSDLQVTAAFGVAALNSTPSVFASIPTSKSYIAVPITTALPTSTSVTVITDKKETSVATAVSTPTTETVSSSSSIPTETALVPPKLSIFSLGGEVSVTSITSSSFLKPAATTTTQASIFGGGITTKSSVFGNGSVFFSSPSTTTSTPVFGQTTANTTSVSFNNNNNQTSVFDAPTTTTTSSGIFGSISKPVFGSSTTSAFSTLKTPIFGVPVTSIFGAPTTSTTAANIFGTSTTSSGIFGPLTTSTVTTASTIFGTSTASGGFGTSTSSIFGGTSPSVFGTPTTSVFGTSTTSIFGTPTTTVFTSPSTSVFGTSTTSIFGAPTTAATIFGTPTTTPSAFGTPTTGVGVFGTPTTSSVFNLSTTPSMFGTPTTSPSVFGTPTTGVSVFGTPTTSTVYSMPTTPSVFGTPATAVAAFGTPTTGISVFGTPTTSTVFSISTASSVFGTPTTSSTSIFGGNTTSSSIFGVPSTSSVFGTSTSSFGAPTSSIFGGFKSTVPTTSVFGQPPAFSSGSIFNTPSSTSSGSIFGNTASSNVFGTPTSSAPFGSSSIFGTPTTSTSPFKSSDIFGSSQANSFSFAPSSNSSSSFGFNKPSFGFGTTTTNTDSGSFNFGGLNVGSATTTANSFSSGFGQTQNPFGRGSSEEQKSPFSGGNVFAAAPVTSSSIFGGPSPFNKSTTAFGSPAAFGSSQNFLPQPSFGQSTFGSGNVFGNPQPGPFSGGTQSVSQTGFGSSAAFVKPSGFGSPPAFGSTTPPGGFGAPPAFGGSPTFGSTPAFGSPGKVFGGSPTADTFGSSGQQNATFANLANQQTLGFGNLAQQNQTVTSQPTGFSGGSSFSTWR